MVVCWLFAALNSLEPPLANLAEVDFFIEDEELKSKRQPDVVSAVRLRLDQLPKALGSRDYLVADEFTVADMMTSSVMKIIHHTDLLDHYPTLERYRDRCFDRPAYRQAIAEQCAAFSDHRPEDMKHELKVDR